MASDARRHAEQMAQQERQRAAGMKLSADP